MICASDVVITDVKNTLKKYIIKPMEKITN